MTLMELLIRCDLFDRDDRGDDCLQRARSTTRPASAKPEGGDAARLWTKYARTWTAWNHIRALSEVVAARLLTIAPLEVVP